MKVNIMLLNALTYTSKPNGEVMSRVGYIFTDKDTKSNNEKFKGYGEQASFYKGTSVFDKIPFEWMGQKILAHCEDRSYPNNPLETRKIITKLEFDGKIIDLL